MPSSATPTACSTVKSCRASWPSACTPASAYHRPRSAVHTLVLDLIELFRVPIVDMPVVAALNRRTFDPDADFDELPGRVLLAESGRRKVVEERTSQGRHLAP